MFGFLKTKAKTSDIRKKPRGIMPTYVRDDGIFLCKSANRVRNTYEIRLAMFMALSQKKPFLLGVPVGAQIFPDLRSHLAQHGGTIREMKIEAFSVYIGHSDAQNKEGDGWVLGDSDTWHSFRKSLKSPWLKDRFTVDVSLTGDDLKQLERELIQESVPQTNVDNENLKDALITLVASARERGGEIYIQ